jgi:hypothetical protein
MGGSGSGSHYHWWRHGKKTAVEDCLSIDVNRWKREGILKADVYLSGSWQWTYRSGGGFRVNYEVDTVDLTSPFVRLWYSWVWKSTQQQESADYRVALTTTRPPFGGLRWWFCCPLIVSGRLCNRRVAKLHMPPQSRYFGCRHCYQLTYTSCQESRKYDGLYRLLAMDTAQDFATVKHRMQRLGRWRLEGSVAGARRKIDDAGGRGTVQSP